MVQRKRVAFVGGPDVDLQRGLLQELARYVELTVLGSTTQACRAYDGTGISADVFPMVSGVNPWRDLQTVSSLTAHFRRLRPDLVHTHDTKISALGRIAARMAGVPLIVGTLPGMGSLYLDDRLPTRVSRLPYELAQRVASEISDMTLLATHDDLEDLVHRRVIRRATSAVVSTSGVDVDAFRPGRLTAERVAEVRASLGLATGACVVTMVSRVIRSKGVLEYAAAASRIKAAVPSVEFLLAGAHDPQGQDTLSAADLDRLTASVRWLGPRSDVPDLLAITDIFALPTYYMEGIPRALLEAGAAGLPIVTTSTRGCRDVVADGVSGILVAPKDAGALAEALLRLVKDPLERRRLGTAARDRMVNEFDLVAVSAKIAAMYAQLFSSRNGHR